MRRAGEIYATRLFDHPFPWSVWKTLFAFSLSCRRPWMTQLYKGNEKRKKSKRKAAQGQSGSRHPRKESTHGASSWDPPLVGEVSAKGGNRGGLCVSLDVSAGVGAANHGHLARIYLRSFLPDRHTLDLPYAARHWDPSWMTKLVVRLACLGRWAERRLRRKRGR